MKSNSEEVNKLNAEFNSFRQQILSTKGNYCMLKYDNKLSKEQVESILKLGASVVLFNNSFMIAIESNKKHLIQNPTAIRTESNTSSLNETKGAKNTLRN